MAGTPAIATLPVPLFCRKVAVTRGAIRLTRAPVCDRLRPATEAETFMLSCDDLVRPASAIDEIAATASNFAALRPRVLIFISDLSLPPESV